MARTGAVWGIDIGQCALKALRCRPNESDNRITADGFDYIEYPKILSQPEADPADLIREALQTFLSRNSVKGDKVAISVSGQSGLARFIKLPPVEAKKIPDIVKYEARQQIPFALEDVVWDYQQMIGGSVEEGFALETEVGLFAMKRDQVYRALKPLTDAGIEVDFVQLTPLAIYNFVVFDQIGELPAAETYDPDDPPPSTVVLSLGTDTTDLVITNGFRVWQRSIPLGGNHFTKALTKELKLTFAKAEHLKRNATKAEDPKAVFQAMRPVFNDLLTEITRSISFFNSVDRNAKIGKILALGNAIKLPGLQKYLSQNLELEVVELEDYRALSGSAVTTAPAFKDNLLTFGVCYGLALQGLGKGKLRTNLVPPEVIKDRMIREKKPWAVAAVAALLAGCGIGFMGHWNAWSAVKLDQYSDAFSAADRAKSQSSQWTGDYSAKEAKRKEVREIAQKLTGHVEERMLWLELLAAIDAALPQETRNPKPEDIGERNEMHIESIDVQKFEDLSTWYTGISKYRPGTAQATAAAATGDQAAADAAQAAPADASAAAETGPTGPGWVVQLSGYHYHNKDTRNAGNFYVRNTLVKNLENAEVKLPTPDGQVTMRVPIKDLGISYPVLITSNNVVQEKLIEPTLDGNAAGQYGSGGYGGDMSSMMQYPGMQGQRPRTGRAPTKKDAKAEGESGEGAKGTETKNSTKTSKKGATKNGVNGTTESMFAEPPEPIIVNRTNFVVQFCWQETPLSKRLEKQREREEAKKAEEQNQQDQETAEAESVETASVQP